MPCCQFSREASAAVRRGPSQKSSTASGGRSGVIIVLEVYWLTVAQPRTKDCKCLNVWRGSGETLLGSNGIRVEPFNTLSVFPSIYIQIMLSVTWTQRVAVTNVPRNPNVSAPGPCDGRIVLHGDAPDEASASATTARGRISFNGSSSRDCAPNRPYQRTASSFFASIARATPPTSAATANARAPAASSKSLPSPRPCADRSTARRPRRKTGTS